LRLLDLQALDSALDRLAHRRDSLPESTRVGELATALREEQDALVTAQAADGDLAREQRKSESDVDLVRTRRERDRARLDTGAVSSPRELENLQSEIASLARRQSELEDQVLEVMERRESLAAQISAAKARVAELAEELATTQARRDALLSEIDAETAAATQQRKELSAHLPAELVSLYEKIRSGQGGIGAAALRQGRCEGCHLQLNTSELNEFRSAAPDQVLRHEECRRILVRTPESGI
ncbi:MAG: zinc ribbon domain-containing protein, partial [Mycobacteriales bacterium]